MRLENYLIEQGGRGKPIPLAEAAKYAVLHCQKALMAKDLIYRGLQVHLGRGSSDHPEVFFVQPSKHERASANTTNFYNMMLSNFPSWKNYPKRNKSLICTTDFYRAGDYGFVYYVIPKDGSKIGICDEGDIWNSFAKVSDPVGLNDMLSHIFRDFFRIHVDDTDWNDIVKGFQMIDKDRDGVINSTLSDKSFRYVIPEEMWDDYRIGKWATFEKMMEWYFDPDANGFRVVTVGSPLPGNVEVWTSGDSILIHKDYWDDFIEATG